jgi:hypothetical protein
MLASESIDIIDATEQTKNRRREDGGISPDNDGKVNRNDQTNAMWWPQPRCTRGQLFPMVRFGRIYEADHLHLVFRKPVTEFHALTTEVLVVPQRHSRCDYSLFNRTQKLITQRTLRCVPGSADFGINVRETVGNESFSK